MTRPRSVTTPAATPSSPFNYADFPLWDMLFGTFRNPPQFEAETGFGDGASKKIGAMLIGRDVAVPSAAMSSAKIA